MTEAFPDQASRDAYERRIADRTAHLGDATVRAAQRNIRIRAFGRQFVDARQNHDDNVQDKASQVKDAAKKAAAFLKDRNVAPETVTGELKNPPGNRGFIRAPKAVPEFGGKPIYPTRLHTPAGKLRSMRPKHDEVDVWIIAKAPKMGKMSNNGLAIDAEGEFYLVGSGQKKGERTATRIEDPEALAEGPANWQKMYGQNARPEFTDDTVDAWQTLLDDYVISQTDPAVMQRLDYIEQRRRHTSANLPPNNVNLNL